MEGEFHEALYDKNINEKMLFTNNARKMAGVPMRRKRDKRKRIFTRNKAEEDLDAFYDYCNGKWDDYFERRSHGKYLCENEKRNQERV